MNKKIFLMITVIASSLTLSAFKPESPIISSSLCESMKNIEKWNLGSDYRPLYLKFGKTIFISDCFPRYKEGKVVAFEEKAPELALRSRKLSLLAIDGKVYESKEGDFGELSGSWKAYRQEKFKEAQGLIKKEFEDEMKLFLEDLKEVKQK